MSFKNYISKDITDIEQSWLCHLNVNLVDNNKIYNVIFYFTPGYSYNNLYSLIPDIISKLDEKNNFIIDNNSIRFKVKFIDLIRVKYNCKCSDNKCKARFKTKKILLNQDNYKVIEDWDTKLMLGDNISIYIQNKNNKNNIIYGIYDQELEMLAICYGKKDKEAFIAKTVKAMPTLLIYSLRDNYEKDKLVDVIDYGKRMYNQCVNRLIRTYFRNISLL